MIGGTDVVFWVREDVPAADVIAQTVYRHWPKMVLTDADDPEPMVRNGEPWPPTIASRHFFIFRDQAAYRSSEEHGVIPENADLILQIILGKRRQPGKKLRSLTIVCGELSGQMKKMIAEIKRALGTYAEKPVRRVKVS